MDSSKQNTNSETQAQEAAVLWVDASTVVNLGIALDYHKLRSQLQAQLSSDFRGRYYDHQLPEKTQNKTSGKKAMGKPDKQLEEWLQKEQQNAANAGFSLQLSAPWTERVRCMYCSCLNAVQFPAPSLLRLQADLLQLLYSNASTTIHLFSNNAALLNSIVQVKGIELAKLYLIAIDDSLETEALKEIGQKLRIIQLDSEQIEQED